MKKIFKRQNFALYICCLTLILFIVGLCYLLFVYQQSVSNLAKQQQWASGKDTFDKAYEVAAANKDIPDKTLYVPKLVSLFDKNIDEVMLEIGKGAYINNKSTVGKATDKIETNANIVLTNEAGDSKHGTPTVDVGLNHNGLSKKISFKCNTWLLGYGALSFVDLVNNEHIIEKAFREAGLNVDDGLCQLPANRSLYTTYDSDGTTLVKESNSFDGNVWQNRQNYKWHADITFDYTIANQKGDLSETVRVINISIES